jgi:hypothetical protein
MEINVARLLARIGSGRETLGEFASASDDLQRIAEEQIDSRRIAGAHRHLDARQRDGQNVVEIMRKLSAELAKRYRLRPPALAVSRVGLAVDDDPFQKACER